MDMDEARLEEGVEEQYRDEGILTMGNIDDGSGPMLGDSLRPHIEFETRSPQMGKSLDEEAEDHLVNQLDLLAGQFNSFNWQNDIFTGIGRQLKSGDREQMRIGCEAMKKVLSTGRDEIYNIAQGLLDEGLINPLLQMLNAESNPPADRLTAAFCVTNVLAGTEEQTSACVRAGAIGPLLHLLTDDDPLLRRQALFALANVAGNTDTDRLLLAESAEYWRNTILALRAAGNKKIEELGCWNLRNTTILGGPGITQCFVAIDFFVCYLKEEVANEDYGGGYNALRFAVETLAAASKTPAGIAYLFGMFVRSPCDPSAASLCITTARFAEDQSTRTYALETVLRLLEYAEPNHRDSPDVHHGRMVVITDMLSRRALEVLTGMLKRVGTYNNIVRVYVARILLLILRRAPEDTSTWAAGRMVQPSLRVEERGRDIIEEPFICPSTPTVTVGSEKLVSKNVKIFTMQLRAATQPKYFTEDALDCEGVIEPKPICFRNGQHHLGIGCMRPTSKAASGWGLEAVHDMPFYEHETDEASTLEILYRIIYNLDGQQEHWTREAAGRTFVGIIAHIGPEFVMRLFHKSVIRCIAEVAETAHVSEIWAKEQAAMADAGLDLLSKRKTDSENIPTDSTDEQLTYIRKLVTPSIGTLAQKAVDNLVNGTPKELKHFMCSSTLNDPEVAVVPRLFKVIGASEDCPVPSHECWNLFEHISLNH